MSCPVGNPVFLPGCHDDRGGAGGDQRPMPGAAGTDGDAGTALDSLRWNAYKSFLKAWKFNFIF